MATKLDELVLELSAETSQLRSELKLAANSTKQATDVMAKAVQGFSDKSTKKVSAFQSTMQTMAGFIGGQAVIGAVKSLGRAFIGLGLGIAESAIELEQTTTQFEVLTGSVGQAEKTIKDLQGFAASTPFQFDGIAQSAQQLLAFGFETEKIIPNLQTLGDIAAGAGTDLKGLALIFGQVKAAGQLTGERLLQLQERGIPIGAALAKSFGVAESAVKDLVSSGKVDFATFEKAMKGLSGEGGLFFEGMVKQSKTLGGVISTLKDNVGLSMSSIGEAILPIAKVIGVELVGAFQELTKIASSGEFQKGVADSMVGLVDAFAVGAQAVDVFIKVFKGSIEALLIPLFAIGEGVTAFINLIKGVENTNPFAMTKLQFEETQKVLEEDTVFASLGDKLQDLGQRGAVAFATIGDTALKAKESNKEVTATVVELTEAEKRRLENLKSFSSELVIQSESVMNAQNMQLENLKNMLEDELITREEFFERVSDLQATQFEREQDMLQQARDKNLITEQEFVAASAQLKKNQTAQAAKEERKKTKQEEAEQKQRMANLKSTFGAITSLSSAENNTLASIGKAAAIAQATMDTFAAANVALRSAPPPFNFALAGLVTTAGLANVAKIGGVGLKGGIDSVPGIGANDSFPSILAPGERVVPAKSNEDLTDFLKDNQSQNREVTVNIIIENRLPASREAGEEMIEVINDALAGGSIKLLGT